MQDTIFNFDNTAILMLETSYLNYEYIYALNKAYGLHLVREENLYVGGREYPCFVYEDNASRLTHVALERPRGATDTAFGPYSMMHLVRGRDAQVFQNLVYGDFVAPKAMPEKDEYRAVEDWQGVEDFRSGVFSIETFNFDRRGGTRTSLLTDPTARVPRATQLFMNTLKGFLQEVFDTFLEMEDYE